MRAREPDPVGVGGIATEAHATKLIVVGLEVAR